MGEIADMMLDGTLCEGCGVYIAEGEAEGYPRYCSSACAPDTEDGFMGVKDIFNKDDDEETSIESICSAIDSAVVLIELAIEDIKAIKIKGRTKELAWLIRRLKAFKEKLHGGETANKDSK